MCSIIHTTCNNRKLFLEHVSVVTIDRCRDQYPLSPFPMRPCRPSTAATGSHFRSSVQTFVFSIVCFYCKCAAPKTHLGTNGCNAYGVLITYPDLHTSGLRENIYGRECAGKYVRMAAAPVVTVPSTIDCLRDRYPLSPFPS
jgi:hypothetical protein